MADFLNVFSELNSTNKIMNLISQNHSAITNNISNCQTPGYVKQNTNFADVIGSMRSPIETTLAKKMGPSPSLMENDGKVVLEEEITNMQRNFLMYSMVSRRAGALITIIKSTAQAGR